MSKVKSINTGSVRMGLILTILLCVTILVSLTLGRYPLKTGEIIHLIYYHLFDISGLSNGASESVLFNVRLPRVFGAILVGMALSGAGACYQSIFRNPMVDSSLLGVTAGASLGAAFGILMGFGIVIIQMISFSFGLGAVMLTLLLSRMVSKKNDSLLTLVLSGIVTGTLLTSCLSLIKYLADPYSKLPAITYWLMGSLASINPSDTRIAAITTAIGIIPLLLLRWRIDALSYGDEEALTLGVNVRQIRGILIAASTLLTASVISISGMIGWIGLVVPHLARMLVGPSFRVLLPTAILLGGLYLLLVDTIARVVFPIEIPMGILTSILGAPFFVYLLAKGKKGWV
jgi:iron complex transport system permease protein